MELTLASPLTNLPATLQLHVRGMVYWTCPHCESLNHSRASASSWKVQCFNRDWRRRRQIAAFHKDIPPGPKRQDTQVALNLKRIST